MSRRPREVYCGHARLCVCLSVYLSAAACLHYCTDPNVTRRSGRGCPLVVHYWADLQSVHGLRCYGNTRNAWQSPAAIRPAHRTPHALRMPAKTPLTSDNIDAPARLLRAPFHMVHTAGCCNANAKCERVYMLVLALCLVPFAVTFCKMKSMRQLNKTRRG